MKTILGLDPGLASTGYGVISVDGSRLVHVCHGAVRTTPDMAAGDRLLKIKREIESLLQTYKPDDAGVEALFFTRNVRTAIPVAQAKGVLLLCLAEAGIGAAEYTPNQVKQSVVGRGRAEKAQVQESIRLIFGLAEVPVTDHAADALAVAVCHANNSAVRQVIDLASGGASRSPAAPTAAALFAEATQAKRPQRPRRRG